MGEQNSKANLFLVGAMKAGTTGFLNVLGQHDDIYTCPVKEPHFFVNQLPRTLYEPSRFFSLEEYLDKDFPEPLHIAKIENVSQYEKIFSLSSSQRYLAEGSTAYLHCSETPERIRKYNPQAKIIVLLRDPLERAFSHFMMNQGKGRENRTFNEAMNQGLVDLDAGHLHWSSYLKMSCYDASIASFKANFDAVLLIRFEDFVKEREGVLKKVSEFLSVTTFNDTEVGQKNASRSLRFQKLFYFLKQLGLKDYFSKLFGNKFKQRLYTWVSKRDKPEMALDADTKERLEDYFKEQSRAWYY